MVFSNDWWESHIDEFYTLFYNKNKGIWKIVWGQLASKAYASTYIKSHVWLNLPGEKPTYEDIKELRWPSARKYFEDHGTQVIEQLTQSDLNNLYRDLKENFGIGEKAFARKYRNNYSFSEARLKSIYRTEVHLSQRFAAIDGAKKANLRYKTWHATGDEAMCPICGELNGEKRLVEEPYSNNEMVAHGHPRCRCVDTFSNN